MSESAGKYPFDGFLVREYRDDDWPQVECLWLETGLGTPERSDNDKTIKKTLRLGGKLFILEGKDTGAIVGTAWVTFDGRRLRLHHMGVLPEFQGNGLSHVLMKKCLEFAREMQTQIKLEVHQTNKIARNLYKKWGFKYLGDYDVFIIRDTADLDNS
ncbi:MAG: GNAT family N-acetyltransferase [Chlorobi bacterium]|nr:GNAT family N-acetyltransferase [Chlorobiota bacterium]